MEEALQTIFSQFEGNEEEIIPILQKVQENYTFLPEDSMKEIARFTRVPESDIYGVATFYAQFRFSQRDAIIFAFAEERPAMCVGPCHFRRSYGECWAWKGRGLPKIWNTRLRP